MGSAFAETLLAADFEVVGFDRDPLRSLPLHDRLVAMAARGWEDLDRSALGLLAASDAGLRTSMPASTCKP